MRYRWLYLVVVCLGLVASFEEEALAPPSSRNYTLTLSQKPMDVNGVSIGRIVINGSLKAPVLEATKGDTLTVTVKNNLNRETLIHWHGVIVPNSQDGSPFTTPMIKSGGTAVYSFPVKQTGTYWYHAHTLDEQMGLSGAIVFKEPNAPAPPIEERVVLLSEASKLSPETIDNKLKTQSNAFSSELQSNVGKVAQWLYGKDSEEASSSHSSVMEEGMASMNSSMMRMHSAMMGHGSKNTNHSMMMHSDEVAYDGYLINNKLEERFSDIKGDKVKLRLINAGATSYFDIVYAGGDITIVASDGLEVKPVAVSTLRIAMGETYDIILNRPKETSFELLFLTPERSGATRVFIGEGREVLVKRDLVKTMKAPKSVYKLLITKDQSVVSFMPDAKDIQVVKASLLLEGKYDWILKVDKVKGKDISLKSSLPEEIAMKLGSSVRMTITNETPMPHPLHLHGMFFRIKEMPNLIKHTINIAPMQTLTLEVNVDAPGKWFFHCHNLYHMMGMSKILVVA